MNIYVWVRSIMSDMTRKLSGLVHWPLSFAATVLLLLAALGGTSIARRAETLGPFYLAARLLPANHLLRESDISLDPGLSDAAAALAPDATKLAGRYLARSYDVGEPIRPGELQAAPCIEPPAGRLAISIPVASQAPLSRFEPGWLADICGSDSCLVQNVPILALECPSDECSVIVAVSKDDAEKVVSQKGGGPSVRPHIRIGDGK